MDGPDQAYVWDTCCWPQEGRIRFEKGNSDSFRLGSGYSWKEKVNVGYVGSGEIHLSLSRNDLVDLLLTQVRGKEFMKKAPAISN